MTTAALPQPVQACRYNVRDVGFVDLGSSVYLLAEIVDPETAPDTSLIDQAIFNLLRDTNVQFARLTKTEAVERGLIPSDSRSAVPRCLLVRPDNRTLDLSGQLTADRARLEAIARSVTDSPLRQRLLQRLIDSHSVVLVVGNDAEDRAAAIEAADAAIDRALAARELWDKPIDSVPTRLVLTADELEGDPILAWALELDDQSDAVQVAVLYGRGRRLGDVLRGEAIDVNQIQRKLALVGRDCECELDRRQIDKHMIPHVWTGGLAARAAKSLGFDPGNPLIVHEVELIMARSSQPREGAPQAVGRPEEDLWGYQEIDLSGIEMPVEEAESTDIETALDPATTKSESIAQLVHEAPTGRTPRGLWLTVIIVAVASIVGSFLVLLRRG